MVALRLLPLVFLSAFALFEDMFHTTSVDNLTDLEIAVRDIDYMTIAVYYDEEGVNSIAMERLLQETMRLYLGFFEIVAYECTGNAKICPPQMIPNLPVIMAYVPQGYSAEGKAMVVNRQLKAEKVDQATINQFVLDNAPFLGEVVLAEEADDFFAQEQFNSIVLFTDEDNVAPEFCALTSTFRGRANFGMIRKDEKALVERFNIKKFPSLVVVKSGEHFVQPEHVQPEYNYDLGDMIEFVKEYVTDEKIVPTFAEDSMYPELVFTAENFEQQLASDHRIAIVQFYKDTQLNEWPMVHEEFKGLLITAGMDCTVPENAKYAKSLGVKKYPAIRLFPANRDKKSFTMVYENLIELSEEVRKNLKSNVEDCQNEKELLNFVSMQRYKDTMGVLLFSESQIPLSFVALSDDPQFKNVMNFARTVEKENGQLIRGFGVSHYPSLVAFEVLDDQLKVLPVQMTGDIFNYIAVQRFLQERLNSYYERVPEILQDDIEEEEIEMFSSSRFASQCAPGDKSCVIFIYDQEKFGKIGRDYVRAMKKLSVEFRRKGVPLAFGWLDGGCYPDVLEKFGVSAGDLPTMVLYSHKQQQIGKLDKELTYENAREQVVNLLVQGSDYFQTSAEGVNISDRKCKAFRKEIASAGTDAARQEVIASFQKKEEEAASNPDESTGKKDKKKKKKRSKGDL